MSKIELRRADIEKCSICKKGLLHAGDIASYHVGISQYLANTREIERVHGLELMLGSPGLAAVMGPNQPLFNRVSLVEGYLCQTCFLNYELVLAEAWEQIGKVQAQREEESRED